MRKKTIDEEEEEEYDGPLKAHDGSKGYGGGWVGMYVCLF